MLVKISFSHCFTCIVHMLKAIVYNFLAVFLFMNDLLFCIYSVTDLIVDHGSLLTANPQARLFQ